MVQVVEPVYGMDDGEQLKVVVVVVWMAKAVGLLVELVPWEESPP